MAAIDLSKISKRDRILLALTALVIAVVLFNRSLYRPRKARIEILQQNVQAFKLELDLIKIKIEQGGEGKLKIEEEVEGLEEELRESGKKLPKVEMASLVQEELSKEARSSGVDFTKLKPGEGEKKGIHEIMPLELDASCRYLGLFRFLSNLKGIPGLAIVRDSRIEASQREPPILRVRMVLDLHFLAPEEKKEEKKEEPRGKSEGEEEVREEVKQVEVQEKEEAEQARGLPLGLQAKEKTEEGLLALKRDPFSFWAEKGTGGLKPEEGDPREIGLKAIIYDPSGKTEPLAMIRGEFFKKGDEVDGKKIEKIEENRIILNDGRRKIIYSLEEEKP